MLKRAVAIKVLPAGLAGEAERISRFQREAELLASLGIVTSSSCLWHPDDAPSSEAHVTFPINLSLSK